MLFFQKYAKKSQVDYLFYNYGRRSLNQQASNFDGVHLLFTSCLLLQGQAILYSYDTMVDQLAITWFSIY